MNKKTKITVIAAAAVIVLAAIIIFAAKFAQKKETAEPTDVQTHTTEDTKVYTPTFMYFVSNNDTGFDATSNMIEELKKEYDGRVNFEIINVDDVPEAKENFPVDQHTPALIMLNSKNDISAIEFKCSDKQKLRQYIESALK